MKQCLQMYIGQELKNTQYRKKHNRRVSSIMTQIRMQAQSDNDLPNDRMKKLDIIANQFKNQGHGCKKKNNRSSIKLQKISSFMPQPCKKSYKKSEVTLRNFRVKRNTKIRQISVFKQFRQDGQTVRTSLQTPTQLQHQKTLNDFFKEIRQSKELSKRYFSIQQQNIHKLNSFIRGAYEINQFSDVVNLNQIDRFRRDFYVYDKLYNSVAQANLQAKMCLKDVSQQKFRDIVFVNEQKDHATAPQFKQILKQLKIIR